jgi:choloylglycine hydrolase
MVVNGVETGRNALWRLMAVLFGGGIFAALAACGGAAPDNLTRFAGHYEVGPGYTITISVEEGALFYKPTGQMYADRLRGDPDQGYSLDDPAWDARLFFTGGRRGPAGELIIRKPNREHRCPRVGVPVAGEPLSVEETARTVWIPTAQAGTSTPVERTLGSLQRFGELLLIDFTADYRAMLESADSWAFAVSSERLGELGFSCSLFFTGGQSARPLFGRNFDNEPCEFLVGRYHAPGCYRSIAFTRISDLGIASPVDTGSLTREERYRFLAAPFFVADGMNEHGVTVALAAHRLQEVVLDPARPAVHVSALCRIILDRAKTVDEALALTYGHNVFDMRDNGAYLLEHHILVADASGASAVLEGVDGGMRAVSADRRDQVATNFRMHGLDEAGRRERCTRYETLSDAVASADSSFEWTDAMRLLRAVSGSTPRSAVYDLQEREVFVVTDRRYDEPVRIRPFD